LLQMFFHTADLIVIGRFASEQAFAAVGAMPCLIALLVNVCYGLSTGTGVVIAQCRGANDVRGVSRGIHTALCMSIVCGAVITATGMLVTEPLLRASSVPEDLMGYARKYLYICYSGSVFISIYNFSGSMLRALGDSRSPFVSIAMAGTINLALDVLLVACFGMDVVGVAVATVVSQAISAFMVTLGVHRIGGAARIRTKLLRFDMHSLGRMLKVGIPASVQSILLPVASIFSQGAVNSFGTAAIAGMAASGNVDSYVTTAVPAFHQTSLNFSGQNYGAGRIDRVWRAHLFSTVYAMVFVVALSVVAYVFAAPLVKLYGATPEAVSWGVRKIHFIAPLLVLICIPDVAAGTMRGLGHTAETVAIVLFCAGFTVFWVLVVFPITHTFELLMTGWPIDWILSGVLHSTALVVILRRLGRETEMYRGRRYEGQ
ncbi:MAG: polysaccharide biosynthesis C-terminal domain-containing protein, partial [Victivallaceae bacterium]|nr:polysaccharide biosynthesis C-terminal domain-containing protein [Victivallaceae bacterium]